MRILHLASSHRWTGAAEPAASLAAAQRSLGHHVEFACIQGHSFWRRLRERDIPFVEGFSFLPGLRLGAILADVRRLRRLVAERRYDVLHCHLTHDHWIAAVALKGPFSASSSRKSGGSGGSAPPPILVRTMHRDVVPNGGILSRWIFRSATDLLIAVSRSGRTSIAERLDLDPGRVVWVRGAVDLARFNPGIDRGINREEWSLRPDAPVAGIVARMQPHRGHLEFLETIEAVVSKVPDAAYIIAGRGERKKAIRARIAEHPLRSRLIEVGYRKHDLPETYAAMDVAVLLAPGSDGSCRAMLEAMACGRPVIGINEGAMADAIEPGKTGWLIQPGALRDELVKALEESLGDRGRTARMGRRAREKMEAEYRQEKRAEATLAAYDQARAGRNSSLAHHD
ncbi:glycosyltransferase family 4 protein [Candidatus Sumerlaeota bacterium]|nr:glycosyltransferase family 4 protein [Candidatus Sumerlaeota bacterium]